MVVLRLHTVRAQQSRACGQPIVVRREKTRVAEGAKILARKKREAAKGADSADRLRAIRRADRLRGVLDNRNARAARRLHERIERRVGKECRSQVTPCQ